MKSLIKWNKKKKMKITSNFICDEIAATIWIKENVNLLAMFLQKSDASKDKNSRENEGIQNKENL